jgi:hypothetical protein
MISRIVSLLLFSAACVFFTRAHAIPVPSRWTAAVLVYAAGAALLALRDVFFRPPPERPRYRRVSTWIASIAVVCVALFFRTRYISTVPLSFMREQYAQVYNVAAQLVNEGFFYFPICGYTSSLHIYMIALVWKIWGISITYARYFIAAWGVLSATVMFWWVKKLFGLRAAFLGGLLIAVSPYHQAACRAGHNVPYLPFFAMLFSGLLYQMTRSDRKMLPAILAGAAFTLGVHGHWAFTLLGAAALLFLVYCAITERGFLKSNRGALIMLAAATMLFMTPCAVYFLRYPNRADYMFRMANTAPGPGAMKYISNLRTCFVAYATSSRFLPAANTAVLIAGGVGLFLSLIRCFRSRAHALVLIFFVVTLAGIVTTRDDIAYVSYLLIYWLAFAAIAGAEAWMALESLFPSRVWRVAAGAVAIAAIGMCAVLDYRIFFHIYAFKAQILPPSPERSACYLVEDIRSEAKNHDLYLSMYNPNHDIGMELLHLRNHFPPYAFLKSALPIRTASLFFPGAPRGNNKGLVAYLPPTPFWTGVQIPRLALLYPHIEVTAFPAPPPWGERQSPILMKFTIPSDDLRHRRGLSVERVSRDGWLARGYFVAEKPGTYLFRCGKDSRVEVGGMPVDGPLTLAAGAVSVQVTGTKRSSPELHVYWKDEGLAPVEINGNIFNAPQAAEAAIASCISKPALPARSIYTVQKIYDLREAGIDDPSDAIAFNDTVVCVRRNGELIELTTDLSPVSTFPLGGGGDYCLEISPGGDIFAFLRGGNTVHVKKPGLPPRSVKIGGITNLQTLHFDREGRCYMLTKTKVRVCAPSEIETTLHETSLPLFPLKPSMVAVGPEGDIALLDLYRQELVILHPGGEKISRTTILAPWQDSFILSDVGGEWFVRVLTEGGFTTLDRDLAPLLYQPPAGEQNPFRESSTGRGQNFPIACKAHCLAGDGACYLWETTFVRMRRQEIPAPLKERLNRAE